MEQGGLAHVMRSWIRVGMDASAIVPTRRCELLATTLQSVLRQRGLDLEVIVVDEASSDDTPAMLAALGDSRLRIIRHNEPCGLSAALNDGAACAADRTSSDGQLRGGNSVRSTPGFSAAKTGTCRSARPSMASQRGSAGR